MKSFIDQQSDILKKQIQKFGEFFFGNQWKINIWCCLFQDLENSIQRILKMCQIENAKAFCDGVRLTLEESIKQLKVIEDKITQSQESKKKNGLSWQLFLFDQKSFKDSFDSQQF